MRLEGRPGSFRISIFGLNSGPLSWNNLYRINHLNEYNKNLRDRLTESKNWWMIDEACTRVHRALNTNLLGLANPEGPCFNSPGLLCCTRSVIYTSERVPAFRKSAIDDVRVKLRFCACIAAP